MNAGLGGLHWIMLIMHWRCWTRHVVDFIDFEIQRKSDIVPDKLEPLIVQQMQNIFSSTGVKIIHTDDFVTLLQ